MNNWAGKSPLERLYEASVELCADREFGALIMEGMRQDREAGRDSAPRTMRHLHDYLAARGLAFTERIALSNAYVGGMASGLVYIERSFDRELNHGRPRPSWWRRWR